MSEISSLELTAGVAVVATAISAFSAFCPPMSSVLLDSRSATTRKAVDFGQNAAAVATLSAGVVLSFVSSSPMPLVFALAIAFGLSFAYEFAFRREI